MPDDIRITYVELDDGGNKYTRPVSKLLYAEWTRNGVREHAANDDGGDNIPRDVSEALAYIVAPHLRPVEPMAGGR